MSGEGASPAEPPVWACRSANRGTGAATWLRWASPRPRSSLGLWVIFPAIRTIIRSFFDDQGGQFDGFVWFENYQKLFNDPNTVTAIKNNAIWVGVVPAS